MRKKLSDRGVAALKPRAARYAHPDPELRGLWIRVQPSGAKSFVVVSRTPQGRQIWATIGGCDLLDIATARSRGREAIQRIRAGLTAFEAQPLRPTTFGEIAAQWLKRYVVPNKLRSEYEIKRILDVYVLPRFQDVPIQSIRRGDVTALLDDIEDEHGARQSDAALGVVRQIMHWHAGRHDDYIVPIIRNMRRTSTAARARTRILDDDELRNLWRATEEAGPFNALVRLLLLTGQRRAKVIGMQWDDLADGIWTIRSQAREKGHAGALKLPAPALAVIGVQPRFAGNTHVFAAARGPGHFRAFSKYKRELAARLPPMPQWGLHDLRRTARSLMSRAGIRSDISERVLGHVQAGVAGVYDRHVYRDEKADALARLARLIETIVGDTPDGNVVALPLEAKHARH
jgi:integrase